MPEREFLNPPDDITTRVRAICAALPETTEHPSRRGSIFWRIRGGTFAYLDSVVRNEEVVTALTFRASGVELDALLHVGHPFYPGWGGGLSAIVLVDDTDWDEVAEVLADSYCHLAPKKLAALVDGGATPRH